MRQGKHPPVRQANAPPVLLTVAQTAKLLGRSESGVRHLIFFAEENGFAACVVRIGRSVRIREDRLAEFIERHTGVEPFDYSNEWREAHA